MSWNGHHSRENRNARFLSKGKSCLYQWLLLLIPVCGLCRYSQLRANSQCLQPQPCSLATRRKQEFLLTVKEELEKEEEEDDPYSFLYQLPTPGTHDRSLSGVAASHSSCCFRQNFNCGGYDQCTSITLFHWECMM